MGNVNYIKYMCEMNHYKRVLAIMVNLLKTEVFFKLCINDKINDGIIVFSYTDSCYLVQAKTLNRTITDDKKYYLF